jgi:hypothetical protein
VAYVAEARVAGDMGESEAASRSQRRRWEGGRLAMVRAYTVPLLRRAFSTGGKVPADLAADLMVPPLATLVLAAGLGTALALLILHRDPAALLPWLSADLMLAIYCLRGWALSGLGLAALPLLFWGPIFILWKLSLRFRPAPEGKQEWVRTPRPGEAPAMAAFSEAEGEAEGRGSQS